MMICKSAILLASLVTVMVAPPQAPSATGPHGSVDLVSDVAAIQPGRPFWLGLRFRLEAGWHIYWTNPGDSGEPPRVKWNLPAGFEAGPIAWPVPRRIEDHSLVDYGYLNEVLLPVEIKPAAAAGAQSPVPISAAVNWLVCREICMPGRASLSLTLPAQEGAPAPSHLHSRFVQARSSLPAPLPASWKTEASLAAKDFILTVDTGRLQHQAAFFPLEPNLIENAALQKVLPSGRGFRLEMVKSDQLIKPPTRLTGVLELSPGQGYLISAPVIARK